MGKICVVRNACCFAKAEACGKPEMPQVGLGDTNPYKTDTYNNMPFIAIDIIGNN